MSLLPMRYDPLRKRRPWFADDQPDPFHRDTQPEPTISPRTPAYIPPTAPSEPPGPELRARTIDMDPRGVPVPSLPGRSGGPTPYDPIDQARYEHVRAGRNSDNTRGFGDRLKSAALPALLGFLQGASRDKDNPLVAGAGGAATAGAIGAINPTAGREFEFETMERPRIEEGIKRQQQREDREFQRRAQTLQVENIQSQIDDRRLDRETQERIRKEDRESQERWRREDRAERRAQSIDAAGIRREDLRRKREDDARDYEIQARRLDIEGRNAEANMMRAEADRVRSEAEADKPEKYPKPSNNFEELLIVAEEKKALAQRLFQEGDEEGAYKALQEAQDAAKAAAPLADRYGYEVGLGDKKWPYSKPKDQSQKQRATSPAASPSSSATAPGRNVQYLSDRYKGVDLRP